MAAGLEGPTASIYFAANALVATGAKLDSAAVAAALARALKKDDGLLSLGLAFHTAALLQGDLAKFFDRIEDAVVQADEVLFIYLFYLFIYLFRWTARCCSSRAVSP